MKTLYLTTLVIGAMLRTTLPEGGMTNILAIASIVVSMAALMVAIHENDKGLASTWFGVAALFAGFAAAHAASLMPATWWSTLAPAMGMVFCGITLLSVIAVWMVSRQQHRLAILPLKR